MSKRLITSHKLELVSRCFTLIKTGEMDFLLSFDDRDFLAGDTVILCEWEHGKLTGKTTQRQIKYILRKYKGLQTGHLVMGFEQLLKAD